MRAYCKKHRHKDGYVVVQDLSRFARNNEDQAQTIRELRRINILVRSTYESNIGETSAGRLAANIFGTADTSLPQRSATTCQEFRQTELLTDIFAYLRWLSGKNE